MLIIDESIISITRGDVRLQLGGVWHAAITAPESSEGRGQHEFLH